MIVIVNLDEEKGDGSMNLGQVFSPHNQNQD